VGVGVWGVSCCALCPSKVATGFSVQSLDSITRRCDDRISQRCITVRSHGNRKSDFSSALEEK
jgi:hypothetical protein